MTGMRSAGWGAIAAPGDHPHRDHSRFSGTGDAGHCLHPSAVLRFPFISLADAIAAIGSVG
jgi:hypothetical protein